VGWEGKQAGKQISNHTGYEAHSAVLDVKILFSPAKPRVALAECPWSQSGDRNGK
jgi:hypothetical protein